MALTQKAAKARDDFLAALDRSDKAALASMKHPDFQAKAKMDAGATLPMRAAALGRLETIKALAQAGADLNARGDDGDTAIAAAAKAGQIKAIKALMAVGASAGYKDGQGRFLTDTLRDFGHLGAWDAQWPTPNKIDSLDGIPDLRLHLSSLGRQECLAAVGATPERRMAALGPAAMVPNARWVRYGEIYETSLSMSIRLDDQPYFDLLIKSGAANPNWAPSDPLAGESPLMVALTHGRKWALKALLDAGANPNAREPVISQLNGAWAAQPPSENSPSVLDRLRQSPSRMSSTISPYQWNKAPKATLANFATMAQHYASTYGIPGLIDPQKAKAIAALDPEHLVFPMLSAVQPHLRDAAAQEAADKPRRHAIMEEAIEASDLAETFAHLAGNAKAIEKLARSAADNVAILG